MVGPATFRFLNHEHTLAGPDDWNDPTGRAKLWDYNLHYFDDLNASGAADRRAWHEAMVERWIGANPPGEGNGWEPYPTSLRLVNWIKWALGGDALAPEAVPSIAVQVRWLAERLERHLLGNHLFANAKALAFAGCWFYGPEADAWFATAMDILEREIPEQILADGGHFERSPMYHALALEDMLDLVNLATTYPARFAPHRAALARWRSVVQPMLAWLGAMSHPDDGIAFFNDAAFGIAPDSVELRDYAARLGFDASQPPEGIVRLADSGYIRAAIGDAVLLVDAAPIGPDYLPGHAHADTLSFELSVRGRRVVVNSGTSRYGVGPERERERGTAAHSTVEIDGADSSEVWAGFRVARRAYPFNVAVEHDERSVTIRAAHDGYRRLPGRPVHRRTWILTSDRLEVRDAIEGQFGSATGRVYFHPALARTTMDSTDTLGMDGGPSLRWRTDDPDATLAPATWHPEFGLSLPNLCLSTSIRPQGDPATGRLVLEWT